jgi:hypothetical protein
MDDSIQNRCDDLFENLEQWRLTESWIDILKAKTEKIAGLVVDLVIACLPYTPFEKATKHWYLERAQLIVDMIIEDPNKWAPLLFGYPESFCDPKEYYLNTLKGIVEKDNYVAPTEPVDILEQLISLFGFYEMITSAIPGTESPKPLQKFLERIRQGNHLSDVVFKADHALSLLLCNAGKAIATAEQKGKRDGDRTIKSDLSGKERKSGIVSRVLEQYDQIDPEMKKEWGSNRTPYAEHILAELKSQWKEERKRKGNEKGKKEWKFDTIWRILKKEELPPK